MKWRIMVVDDEEDVRTILKSALGEKFEVVEAMDGLDALEKLERYEPDFICMDVMMPMMDGFEACAAIRRSSRFSEIPVMFLTAMGNKESIKKGYEKGANLYLTKPFDPERLIKNIEVHFTSNKSSPRVKRLSMAQIKQIEEQGIEPAAPGAPIEAQAVERKAASKEVVPPMPSTTVIAKPKGLLPRIMVVDDEPDIITMVTHALGLQAEVVSAFDGIQAIERLVRYQPDMMMIDIMIPRMSGFQLCQSLRANRAFKELPILVCSGRCSERDRQFALRVGANDFLAKPFTPTELVAKFTALGAGPGFRVRPKAVALEDIRRSEAPPEQDDVFQETEDASGAARRGGVPAKKKTSSEVIGDFLHQQQKKEENASASAGGDDEEKKRKLFRFGKK